MERKDFLQMVVSNPLIRMFIPSFEVRQFIACQFALESDFGDSKLAKIHHNYCGMKVPFRRVSYRSGVYKGFSTYYDFNFCCADYIAWLLYYSPRQIEIDVLSEFKLFLIASRYCPEKDYISRIESIYNQYFNSNN